MSGVTIGEVLNRLKAEFDDVTISKIRFLESEGLISPDRTESGYRKFTDDDVGRLRYVLRAQRDRYLPLKVIRTELEDLDAQGAPVPGADEDPDAGHGAHADDGAVALPLDVEVGGREQLTSSQLATRVGLSERHVAELREHSLLGAEPYDRAALAIAEAAARLMRDGLEVRHLRMYRQFADREAGVVEQLVAPLLRQRNPQSRDAAVEQAERVVAAGNDLRRFLLGRELRGVLKP